ncbi:MAG: ABC transporter substrate-binding protein [Arcobacteraceae bacterium]|jgi:phospholipid transport system substrate-binding protein|nr:ABC transporter substrate-binding protein [Arcobacteraceae bacterium]
MKYCNQILKALLACFIVFNTAYALQEDKILSIMTDKINKATQILQNQHMDKNHKQKDIFDIFDAVFDYELMAKLSLGKQWNMLESQQQKLFTQSFEQRLKASYIDKLYLYTNQKIIVKDMIKPKDNRIEVIMHILGEKETFEVIYKFYKSGTSDWFIYDVNILGISIIQTYRNQFVGVLQKETFEELIQRLNKVEAVIK